ncbi:MAG: ABC transporter permease [Coriobacteriaceae bacterium]|jgi:putative ABC transport system permease protein|nr:ABC transporter permease [Coriobacteriaceae bacterium]
MYAKLAFRSVRRSLRDFAIYFFTLAFGACVFYAFNSIADQQAVLTLSERQMQVIGMLESLIQMVTVFLAVVFGFLVLYANRYLIRRRKKEFAIFLSLGMSRGHISRIIVMETVLVGLGALVAGLVLGYLLSQVLLLVTALLFETEVAGFALFFSPGAAAFTLGCFIIIFVCVLVFNIVTVSRYKLIDLLLAGQMSESPKLRRLSAAIVLFVVSLAMIGVSYWLLIDNGMLDFGNQFIASTLLVCTGTVLFFFSLAGFLLRLVQGSKGLYLRGLNMFTLRQLSSKVNSAFLSISLVCMVLFCALTAMCIGFSTVTSFNGMLEKNTRFDASYVANYGVGQMPGEEQTIVERQAQADGYDMARAFARHVESWDSLVGSSVQIDLFDAGITLGDLLDVSGYRFSGAYAEIEGTRLRETPVDVITLSRFNALRASLGEAPASLAADEFAVWCDMDDFQGLYEGFFRQGGVLEVFGTTLRPQGKEAFDTLVATGQAGGNSGVLVVPDAVVPAGTSPSKSVLNIKFNGARETIDPLFTAAVAAAYGNAYYNGTVNDLNKGDYGWPFISGSSAQDYYEQNNSLTAVISYLAIYIGLILLITCAAILALQQLTQAADNAQRYALLGKIGTDKRMVNGALFWQTVIYFVFPLVLALAHSAVAMSVAKDVVQLFGHLDIEAPLAMTASVAVAVYGGYFLFTYLASRNTIRAVRG